jgi:peptidoglycan/LPS O-acetylase OafA/YrhL
MASRVAARLAILDAWPGSFVLTIGSGMLVGIAYHYLFERPALRAVRRGWQPRLRPARSPV